MLTQNVICEAPCTIINVSVWRGGAVSHHCSAQLALCVRVYTATGFIIKLSLPSGHKSIEPTTITCVDVHIRQRLFYYCLISASFTPWDHAVRNLLEYSFQIRPHQLVWSQKCAVGPLLLGLSCSKQEAYSEFGGMRVKVVSCKTRTMSWKWLESFVMLKDTAEALMNHPLQMLNKPFSKTLSW